jgi:hypothetical protein
MRLLIAAALCWFLAQPCCAQVAPSGPAGDAFGHEGFYALAASPVWDEIRPDHQAAVPSPDGASVAASIGRSAGQVTLRVTSGRWRATIRLGAGVASELLWSPDSSAFFVSTSEGGANGPFRTLVVFIGQHRLTVRDVSPLVARQFGKPIKCDLWRGPNIGGVAWGSSPDTLLVAAEIPHEHNCDSAGNFRIYEVDWRRMRILASYDQIAAKQSFRDSLGSELRSSNDACVRSPRVCQLASNHLKQRRRVFGFGA